MGVLVVQLSMKETTTTQESIIKEIKEMNNNSNESIWKQTSSPMELEDQDQDQEAKPKPKSCNQTRRRRRINSLMNKRRSSRSRSSSSARIEQKVSTLRNLVPNINNNNNHESSVESLEQLFTQTADYILSLQTRVRLMNNLVHVLSPPSNDE